MNPAILERLPADFGIASAELLALIADSVICADEDGRILLFNCAAEHAFGYSANEVVGHHVEMLLPEHHRAQHVDQVRSFALGYGPANRLMGHQREVVGQHKNGRQFPAEASVSRQIIDGRTILTAVVRDITERKVLEEQRETIARELDHRVSNVLAVVNAIVSLTARSAESIEEFRDSLQERLGALARTQTALRGGAQPRATLDTLLRDELAQYLSGDECNIVIEGPLVSLTSKAALTLALAVHELATNSAKYGALSQPSGRVAVTFAFQGVEDNQLVFEWHEAGGPLVKPPTRQGFGTTLITQIIKRTFGADVTVDYAPEGFVYRMTLPRTAVEAGSGK